MIAAKRYDLRHEGSMDEVERGPWVRFEDYAEVARHYNRLVENLAMREEHETLVQRTSLAAHPRLAANVFDPAPLYRSLKIEGVDL